MRTIVTLVAIALAGLAATALAASLLYLDGPPAGHTGGFGEESCATCHFDNPVNDGEGEVRVSGFPERYEPGETYTVTVEVRRPGIALGGFQAAVRFAEGERAGRQAGSVRLTDERVTLLETDSVTYLQHTVEGASVEGDLARWSFEWTAPSKAGGKAVLHAAGNAGNGDDSVFGDYIYLAEVVSRVRR